MPRTGPSLAITSSARLDMSQDWGSLNGKVRQWRAQGTHWDELIPAMRGKALVRTQWDQVLEWEQRRELAVVDERGHCHVNRVGPQRPAWIPFQAAPLALSHTLNASFRNRLNVSLLHK